MYRRGSGTDGTYRRSTYDPLVSNDPKRPPMLCSASDGNHVLTLLLHCDYDTITASLLRLTFYQYSLLVYQTHVTRKKRDTLDWLIHTFN
jgi:hypothetical protein